MVNISVFFDGTGNNKDEDEATEKWSNVSRLWRAALPFTQGKDLPNFAIYVSGVGTRFNGDFEWHELKSVLIEDEILGKGFGGGGDRRLDSGHNKVNQRLRDVLIANAKREGGALKAYAEKGASQSFGEVNKALGKHRLIKQINLSVFGFSRGAALARAFSNRVLARCKQEGGGLTYEGYPIRINFAGLFDTVASFGVPAQNVRYPFEERDLIVSPLIERCVHHVAAHELRFSFPVDLIRKNGQLAGNWEEKVYPGVHSDVGGGYTPDEQGLNNNYARIPMRDMMREAVLCGVRMWTYKQVEEINFPLFEKRFECKAETEQHYKNYMAAYGAQSGSVEQQVDRHMALLYSAYGTMNRKGELTVGEKLRQEDKLKRIGPPGFVLEMQRLRQAKKQAEAEAAKARAGGRLQEMVYMYERGAFTQFVMPEAWRMAAWERTAPEGAVAFVKQYVHDSKMDFLSNSEPFSYFRPRGIQESTKPVWQEAGDWLGEKTHQAGDAVKKGAKATGDAIGKAADATEKAASDAYHAGLKKGGELKDAVVEKGEQAKKQAVEAFDKAQHEVGEAVDKAKQKVGEGVDAAANKAKELAQQAERTADAAKQTATDAFDAASKKTGAAIDAVKDGAAKAGKATAETAAEIGNAAQSTAQKVASKVSSLWPW